MERRFRMKLVLEDQFGENRFIVGADLEMQIMSERFVDEIQSGLAYFGPGRSPFEETVKMLKKREFRSDLLVYAAEKLGKDLAQAVQDSEGWHGSDRARKVKEQARGAGLWRSQILQHEADLRLVGSDAVVDGAG